MKYLKLFESFTDEEKNKLILLVGAPSSGKSTYIKNVLSKELDDFIIIERDSIVNKIADKYGLTYDETFISPPEDSKEDHVHPKYGKVVGSPEGVIWSPKSYELIADVNAKIYRKFHKTLSDAVVNDKNIIIDMTNMSRKNRKGILKFVKGREDYYKIAVIFNNGGKDIEDLLINVANKRQKMIEKEGGKKTISADVYTRMFNSYQEPTEEEGFDEIRFVDTKENLKEFLDL